MDDDIGRKLDRIVRLLTIIVIQLGVLVALVVIQTGVDSVLAATVVLLAVGFVVTVLGSAITDRPVVRE